MRFVARIAFLLALASGLTVAAPKALREPHSLGTQVAKSVGDFRDLAIQALESKEADLDRRGETSICTLANARVRRDWYVSAIPSGTLDAMLMLLLW